MHIPDNYLSPSTCAVMGATMLPVWKYSITKVKQKISKKKLPTLGICAAFSFLIMMFNMPVPGGTTAHAVGSVLIALILGPYSATIAVTIALLIQALLFGDGGILAFGANTFNMAFVMPFVGYYLYKFLKNRFKFKNGEYVAAFIGAYVGLVAAASCAGIELGIQPLLFKGPLGHPLYCPYPINISLPAMASVHLIVGLVEGIVTVGVFAYIKKVAPDAIVTEDNTENVSYEYETKNKKSKWYIIIPLVIMIILTPLGLIASGSAWGEWDPSELKDLVGFIPKGMSHGINYSPIGKDYGFSGLGAVSGYLLSAVIGVLILVIIFRVISSLKKE